MSLNMNSVICGREALCNLWVCVGRTPLDDLHRLRERQTAMER